MVTSNAVRFPVSSVLAVVLMACFFSLLFNVISRPQAVVKSDSSRVIQFAPLLRDTPPPPHRFVKPERKPVDPAPPSPHVTPGPRDPDGPVITAPRNHLITPPTPWRGVVAANAVPLVRVEPQYPHRQQTAGVEGWVQLQFTILGSGAVTDVVVVDADPKGAFDEAAIKAVRQWKYSPNIEEGRAVELRGVGVVVKFNLDSP